MIIWKTGTLANFEKNYDIRHTLRKAAQLQETRIII